MWKFLNRLAALRSPSDTPTAHPRLEALEDRQLLTAGPTSDAILATFQRTQAVGDPSTPMYQQVQGVSRFDPATGHEDVLFSKTSDGGLYGSDPSTGAIGQVGAAGNGDLLFSTNYSAWYAPGDASAFQRIDKAGSTSAAFATQKKLDDFAVAKDGSVIAVYSRYQLIAGNFQDTLTLSRFDAHSGNEQVLFQQPISGGMYGGADHVALAADGDIVFSFSNGASDHTDVYRRDAQTGATTQMFGTDHTLTDLAVEPGGAVVGTYSNGSYDWIAGIFAQTTTLSRFDAQTGHEDVLFSTTQDGFYGTGASSVAVASDGDVVFAISQANSWTPGDTDTTVRQVDAQTGEVGTLFTTTGIVSIATQPAAVPVAHAPVAKNDSYSVNKGATLSVPAKGVLNNDTDADGGTLSAQQVSGPKNGALTLKADGSFVYTPKAGFSGTDSFTYKASDGALTGNTATVTITVKPAANQAPVAKNDSYAVNEDTALSVPAKGVLNNDTDADGGTLSAQQVSGPKNGTLTLKADGSFVYTPKAGFSGTDSFTYKASDGALTGNTATVTITVKPAANQAPVAKNDSYAVNEDTALSVPAKGVLGNDTDADGNALTAQLVSGPAHGTLTLKADGSFVYTPRANFNGTDTFTYKAKDAALGSAPATVTITVKPVNDAPIARDNGYSLPEDFKLVIGGKGVTADDTDVDGDKLSVVLVSGPKDGTLKINADGSFSYLPKANFHGTDTFTYKVSDGQRFSNVATVTITVKAVDDAPDAVNDVYTLKKNATTTVLAKVGVLANDMDFDGDKMTAVLVTAPKHGKLTLNADGSFAYTADPGFEGLDSFTYRAKDASVAGDPATVSLLVRA